VRLFLDLWETAVYLHRCGFCAQPYSVFDEPFFLCKKLRRVWGKLRPSGSIVNGLFKYFPTNGYKLEKLAQHRVLLTPFSCSVSQLLKET
jgi:hypothetical protein